MAEVLTEEKTQEETSESKEEEVTKLSEYQILEQNYERVHAQIEKEGKVNFAHEYTQIFNAFRKAYMREEEHREEIKALQAQVETSISNMASAEKLAAVDKEEIYKLRHENNDAWKMVDSSRAREENSQQEIESLGQQITRLKKELERRDRLAMGTLEEFHGDVKGKDNLFRERERLMHEVEMLRERLGSALTGQEDLEKKSSSADQRCSELTQELEYQTNEMYRQVHAKERLEEELKETSLKLERKESEVTNLKHQLGQAQLNTGKLETNAKDLKSLNERLQKDVESLNSRLNKMQVDSKLQAETLETLINEKSTKTHELKMKEEEVIRLCIEAAKLGKMREQCIQKMTQTEKRCASLEQEIKKRDGVIGHLRKDLDMAKKCSESGKKTVHDLHRDRKVLKRKILKASGAACEQEKHVKLQEQEKRNLEKEINSFKFEANKQRKFVASLEKDRDRYIHESQQWAQKVQDTLDEVKLKEAVIFDYEKKISEADTKIHMQQKCFEALESDKITLEKMLLEAQDEIPELKEKLKTMGREIEQLKEDITTKETQLLKQKNVLEESDKEKKNLKIELTKLKDELHECKEQTKALTLEERKLQKIIQDATEERGKQKKVVEQIMNERDILGAQLVRKNNELSLLHEKLNILQHTLHKGEAQYDQRLEDIRLLKLEIGRDRKEKKLLSRSMTYMTDMRQEIFHLEQDLTREKLKCRALEEELQTPLNIHRWRKLEGSDPTKYELIQKVRLLQKRLLAQAERAIKQEDQLQQLDFQCSSLHEMLAHQPGPEVAIQLKTTQDSLRARDKRIKCLVSESIMYKEQVTELRSELERVKDESKQVKEEYYSQKRRLQIMKEHEHQLNSNFTAPTQNSGRTYFMGGGFKLSTGPRNVS